MILLVVVDAYALVVLISVILSWIPSARGNVVSEWVEKLTEPVFERIRRVIPPVGGFDLSPMLLLFALQLLKRLIVELM